MKHLRVKKLQWRVFTHSISFVTCEKLLAETPVGDYVISGVGRPHQAAFFHPSNRWREPAHLIGSGPADGIAEACQRHFNKLVLSCLEEAAK